MLLATAPWFVFASNAIEPVAYAARALLLLTVVYCWLLGDPARRSAGVTLCIAGILGVGALGADLAAPSTWIAVAQFAVLWTVVARHRHVEFSPRIRSRMVLSLVLFAITAALVTLFKPGPFDDSSGVPHLDEYSGPALGPFSNPNELGLVGVTGALLSFLLARADRPSRFARAMYVVSIACCGLVALSGSRTALLGLVVFSVTYFGATWLRSNRWFLGTAFAAVLLAVPIVTTVYAEYGAEIVESGDTETVLDKNILTGRHVIWPIVLAHVAERPVAGYGVGQFPGSEFPGHYEGLSAHNGFLQILYQGGVIALALYGCLFILMVRRGLSLENPEWRAASVGVLCAAIVCDLFEVVLTQNHFGIGIVLWILAAMTVMPSRVRTSGRY